MIDNTYTKADLEMALEAAGGQKRGGGWLCPWHDDKTPSGSVYERDGKWRFYCQRCEKGADLYDLQGGVPPRDEPVRMAPARPQVKPRQLEAIMAGWERQGLTVSMRHDYTDPDTRAIQLSVFRLKDAQGKKTYRQVMPHRGGWINHGIDELMPIRPIYNRRNIRGADVVLVVEGEKCVEALHGVGYAATTSPMGAGKADRADWRPLMGKRVVLWPDNDEAGIEHMEQVASILRRMDCQISSINPGELGLQTKGDAADYINGMTTEEARKAIAALVWTAPMDNPSADYLRRIEQTAAGRRRLLGMPWPMVRDAARPLAPGGICVLGAEPGCGKSLAVMQFAEQQLRDGVNVAVLMLEDCTAFHLERYHAQLAMEPRLTDQDWVEMNPEKARSSYLAHRSDIDAMAKCITCDDSIEKWADCRAWCTRELERGAKLLIIDPLTAFDEGKIWEEQRLFIRSFLKPLLRQHDAAALLINHPKQTGNGMAGSAAIQRFVDSVLWMSRLETKDFGDLETPHGHDTRSYDMVLEIRKGRSGKDTRARFAMQLDPQQLRVLELGRIIADDSTRRPQLGRRPLPPKDERMPAAADDAEDLF